MWFNDDLIVRKKRRHRSRNKSKHHPVLMVNASMKKRRQEWVARTGVVVLLVCGLGVTAALGRIGVIEMGEALFSENDEFTMTNLVVDCDNPEFEEFIREQAGVEPGTNLFMVDIAAIRDALAATANIRSVEVARRLPHTIAIAVSERIPMARLGNSRDRSSSLVVDDEGVVFFGRSISKARGLPNFTGYGREAQMSGNKIKDRVGDALTFLEVCHSAQFGNIMRISEIDIRKDGLRARIHNGPLVSIRWVKEQEKGASPHADLVERLKLLCYIITKHRDAGRPLRTVDLTSDHYRKYCPTTPRWNWRG